jgi:hypothetical protein
MAIQYQQDSFALPKDLFKTLITNLVLDLIWLSWHPGDLQLLFAIYYLGICNPDKQERDLHSLQIELYAWAIIACSILGYPILN